MKKNNIWGMIMASILMVGNLYAAPVNTPVATPTPTVIPEIKSEIPTNVAKYFSPAKKVEVLSGYPYSAAAIDQKGDLWVWGNAKKGLFPLGTNHQCLRYETTLKYNPYVIWPEKVATNVRQIAIDQHTKAGAFMVKEDNTLWGWGISPYSRDLEKLNVTPTKIMDNVREVTTTWGAVYVIKTDGSLWFFKHSTTYGEKVSFMSTLTKPIQVDTNVKQVAQTTNRTFMLKEDGSLWGWGMSYHGEIFSMEKGNPGKPIDQEFPTKVKVMTDVAQVEAGRNHVAVLKTDSSVWTWGSNADAQLGQGKRGTLKEVGKPMQILTDVQKISISETHGAALKKDGSLWCWGGNYYGEIGNGKMTERKISGQEYVIIKDQAALTPVKVRDHIIDVSTGAMQTMAITTEGVVLEWGSLKVDREEKYKLQPTIKIIMDR